MLSLTLVLPLLLPALQDDPPQEDPGPTAEQVEASLASIRAALDKQKPEEIASALQGATYVPHADVVELLADGGLGHEDKGVQRVAMDSLGRLRHADALAALHEHAKSKRKLLRKDVELYVPLLQAIARHGSETSIPLLTRDLFQRPEREVLRARLLGLGGIRSMKAVEKLIDLMKKTGRKQVQPYMEDFRLALAVLTHVDQGTNQDLWLKWWNDNKKTFEVPEQPPKLPEQLQNRWDRFWGEPRRYERQKRRGERGDDPEDDDGR